MMNHFAKRKGCIVGTQKEAFQKRIHVFSVKQNSGTENFQTEHCRKEHLGTRKFQEYQFVMEFEKLFLEKIPGFYFEQGRKFQDF